MMMISPCSLSYYKIPKEKFSTCSLYYMRHFQQQTTTNSPTSFHYTPKSFTTPRTKGQEIYTSQLKQKNKKIVIATGSAGTGKTLFATEYGIRFLLTGEYKKLVFTRPTVTVADEEIGFLKGTLEDKMSPYIQPIYDVLHNFISPKDVELLIQQKTIEICPLGFMRGRTFKDSWILCDEAQNCTQSQMKILLTRIGENSKLIVTGDLNQADRLCGGGRKGGDNKNGLEDFLERFEGKRSTSITCFAFDNVDIQREEVVKEVLEIYSSETCCWFK